MTSALPTCEKVPSKADHNQKGMRVALSSFPTHSSLDTIDVWVRSVQSAGFDPPSMAELAAFTAAVAAERRRRSPNADPSVIAAVQALQTDPRCGIDLGAIVAAVPYSDQFNAVFSKLATIVGEARNATATALGAASGTVSTSSRRARFAQRATDSRLFTAHAGKIAVAADAKRDKFGNALASEHLLSADGACEGTSTATSFEKDNTTPDE